MLAESLLISVLGAIAGLAITLLCDELIKNLTLPVPVPVQLVVLPDWRLLWYSFGIVLVSALLSGLLPALRAVRRDVSHALKQEEHQIGRRWDLRGVLVAGQLAVSIVLLAVGFLFVHNLLRATAMNPGFDVNHTIWAYMRLVPDKYGDPGQAKQMSVEIRRSSRYAPCPVSKRLPLRVEFP